MGTTSSRSSGACSSRRRPRWRRTTPGWRSGSMPPSTSRRSRRSRCNPEDFSWKEGTRRRRRTAAATSRGVSQGATPCPRRRKLTRWFPISPLRESLSSPVMSLSYREFIECRYIGLFRISNSISYRTSHIEYLDILKTNDFFVFFRRKFQKIAENSENSPKIRRKFRKFAENSENSPKIPQKEGLL